MQHERRTLLFCLIRWLACSLTALLLTLPALEGIVAAPLNRSTAEAGHRTLSFEERVAAQKAIEEVFWRHRIWPKDNPGPKPALEKVLPDSVIRERVTDSLKKSNALEKLWHRPLTGAQLQSEMDRMAGSSRQPEVLREVFAALHDDPFLIAECLARPTLADRLLRSWYSSDERFHGLLRAEAQRALAGHPSLSEGTPDGAEYQEITWRSRPAGSDSEDLTDTGREISLPPEDYEAQVRSTRIEARLDPAPADPVGPSNLPDLRDGRFGSLRENEDSFFAKTVIEQKADSMRVGVLSWGKTPFETWWSNERAHLEASLPAPEEYLPVATLDAPACADDTWTPIAWGPEARYLHSAFWTGSEMLVWGGKDTNGIAWTTGFRYNPATDTWKLMNSFGAPSTRTGYTAIWTGTRVIIWGGADTGGTTLATGASYDPSTDTWSATSTGPYAPTEHSAVWTGSEMIVWGGGMSPSPATGSSVGARYNPTSNTWTSTSTTGVPSTRHLHSAVWTGTEMIVWGGEHTQFTPTPVVTQFNTGGRYNPGTNTWSAAGTSTGTNVPSPRSSHSALWTGTQMIIYGGTSLGGDPIAGARYNPGSDTWSTLNTPPYSAARHAAVWTGSKMIAWGGFTNTVPGPTNQGFVYDPSSDTYVTTNLAGAPTARYQHSAVWTGIEMIVWGGTGTGAAALDTGGRYDPTSDSWVPTSRIDSPMARSGHSEIWTGAEMVVWGGDRTGPRPTSGGRYVPATDTWSATNNATGSVPEGRVFHSTVWTGTEMIVWGGMNSAGTRLNSGGRYNPTSDSWAPTGTGASLPAIRLSHSAVWTGTEMIVWGGSGWTGSAPINLNSGGRYDPGTDGWMPTGGGANLPSARSGHTATWTGDRMLIWGGTGSGTPDTTGGRYNPASDSWDAVSASGAPSSPDGHTAVWTGSEVIVWGSFGPSGNTGGRYNPTSNTWSPTSTGSGVPSARTGYTAVWANGEMIVWGGVSGGNATNTGGRYDPASNAWTPTGTGTNVPTPRNGHRAVWTGTEMLVWGGSNLATGARYCRQCATYYSCYRDRDLDLFGDPLATQTTCNSIPLPGFVSGSGDCLDTNASVYPGAPEICDGLNDDCSDPSWPAVPANEANADGDAFRICQGDCDDAHSAVYPGAPQICDGLNDDCLDGSWPTVPANEADADGDGYRLCTPDCSDGNPQVWAAPSEASGLAVLAVNPTSVVWTSQGTSAGPETIYDLVGGTLTSPLGSMDFTAASCLQPSGPNNFSDMRAAPAVNTAYWYLARARNSCGVGTYGGGRSGVPSCP